MTNNQAFETSVDSINQNGTADLSELTVPNSRKFSNRAIMIGLALTGAAGLAGSYRYAHTQGKPQPRAAEAVLGEPGQGLNASVLASKAALPTDGQVTIVIPYFFMDGQKNLYLARFNFLSREIEFSPILRDGKYPIQCLEPEPIKAGVYQLSSALPLFESNEGLALLRRIAEYQPTVSSTKFTLPFELNSQIQSALDGVNKSKPGDQTALGAEVAVVISKVADEIRRDLTQTQTYLLDDVAIKQIEKTIANGVPELQAKARADLLRLQHTKNLDLAQRQNANTRITKFIEGVNKQPKKQLANDFLNRTPTETAIWILEKCLPELLPYLDGRKNPSESNICGLTPFELYCREYAKLIKTPNDSFVKEIYARLGGVAGALEPVLDTIRALNRPDIDRIVSKSPHEPTRIDAGPARLVLEVKPPASGLPRDREPKSSRN